MTAAGQDGPAPDPQPVDVEWLDSLSRIKAREHDPIPTAAGQDGERRKPDHRLDAATVCPDGCQLATFLADSATRAAESASPDDPMRLAERLGLVDRIRRECAEELRRTHRSSHAVLGAVDERGHERKNRCITDGQLWPCIDEQTAEEWSGAGRAPADEEEQR